MTPEPTFEQTAIGPQAVVPGTPTRTMPAAPLRAKRRQAEDLGPLFAGPEPEQLTIEEEG